MGYKLNSYIIENKLNSYIIKNQVVKQRQQMRQSQLSYQVGDVERCLTQLMSSGMLSVDKIGNIIDRYQPILQAELPPLVIADSVQPFRASESRQQLSCLQQRFSGQKFIPSPDLLLNYQQIYIKSFLHNSNNIKEGQLPNIHNNKLSRLYREPSIRNNSNSNPYCSQTNAVNQPVTLPYRALSSTYNQFPVSAENHRVLIEQKHQVILQQLKHNTHQIQTTLPIIQNSLFQNQLKRLQLKQINLQNMVGVKAWKLKRQEIINNLSTNKNNK